MKTLWKIILIWSATLVLMGAADIAHPRRGENGFSDFLLPASSLLMGVVSYFLHKSESRKGAKLVFFNFAMLFVVNGTTRSLYQLAMGLFIPSSQWSDFYFYEYSQLAYFLLLSLCVFCLVADQLVMGCSEYTKYLATLAIVVGVWVATFYPFLLDAKYLYKVTDYRNFVEVRESIASLRSKGNACPSIAEIASYAHLTLSDIVPNDRSMEEHKQRYVAQLQKYIPESNYALLILKPLWLRCSQMGLLSLFLVLFCTAYQYFVDSPRGAYIEKIVWCLIPYCGFEALHFFAYTKITKWNDLNGVIDIGDYLSIAVIWMILFLFGLRLRFIQTVEGNYYERRLLTDASRITRWRDAFDNWVLRQFMNPGELDRRFLTQRRLQD